MEGDIDEVVGPNSFLMQNDALDNDECISDILDGEEDCQGTADDLLIPESGLDKDDEADNLDPSCDEAAIGTLELSEGRTKAQESLERSLMQIDDAFESNERISDILDGDEDFPDTADDILIPESGLAKDTEADELDLSCDEAAVNTLELTEGTKKAQERLGRSNGLGRKKGKGPKDVYPVYVGGVTKSITLEQIKNVFSIAGDVASLHLEGAPNLPENVDCKGHCRVFYSDLQAAKRACQYVKDVSGVPVAVFIPGDDQLIANFPDRLKAGPPVQPVANPSSSLSQLMAVLSSIDDKPAALAAALKLARDNPPELLKKPRTKAEPLSTTAQPVVDEPYSELEHADQSLGRPLTQPSPSGNTHREEKAGQALGVVLTQHLPVNKYRNNSNDRDDNNKKRDSGNGQTKGGQGAGLGALPFSPGIKNINKQVELNLSKGQMQPISGNNLSLAKTQQRIIQAQLIPCNNFRQAKIQQTRLIPNMSIGESKVEGTLETAPRQAPPSNENNTSNIINRQAVRPGNIQLTARQATETNMAKLSVSPPPGPKSDRDLKRILAAKCPAALQIMNEIERRGLTAKHPSGILDEYASRHKLEVTVNWAKDRMTLDLRTVKTHHSMATATCQVSTSNEDDARCKKEARHLSAALILEQLLQQGESLDSFMPRSRIVYAAVTAAPSAATHEPKAKTPIPPPNSQASKRSKSSTPPTAKKPKVVIEYSPALVNSISAKTLKKRLPLQPPQAKTQPGLMGPMVSLREPNVQSRKKQNSLRQAGDLVLDVKRAGRGGLKRSREVIMEVPMSRTQKSVVVPTPMVKARSLSQQGFDTYSSPSTSFLNIIPMSSNLTASLGQQLPGNFQGRTQQLPSLSLREYSQHYSAPDSFPSTSDYRRHSGTTHGAGMGDFSARGGFSGTSLPETSGPQLGGYGDAGPSYAEGISGYGERPGVSSVGNLANHNNDDCCFYVGSSRGREDASTHAAFDLGPGPPNYQGTISGYSSGIEPWHQSAPSGSGRGDNAGGSFSFANESRGYGQYTELSPYGTVRSTVVNGHGNPGSNVRVMAQGNPYSDQSVAMMGNGVSTHSTYGMQHSWQNRGY